MTGLAKPYAPRGREPWTGIAVLTNEQYKEELTKRRTPRVSPTKSRPN